MNKTIRESDDSKWNRRRDIILGIIVIVCLMLSVVGIAKVSINGTEVAIRKSDLQPLKEVTDYICKDEFRYTTRNKEYVIIIKEDDIYEGWGKAAVRSILVTNYFKEDVGQVTIEALWSNEAAESRSRFIKGHTQRKWFEPWINDKQYSLKSVYSCGRFCIRMTSEISVEDEALIMNKIREAVNEEYILH